MASSLHASNPVFGWLIAHHQGLGYQKITLGGQGDAVLEGPPGLGRAVGCTHSISVQ